MTIALVSDATEIPLNNVPAPVHPCKCPQHFARVRLHANHTVIHIEPIMRDTTGKIAYYKPILFPNEFWHLKGARNPSMLPSGTHQLRRAVPRDQYFDPRIPPSGRVPTHELLQVPK
jgi:hypothetical protein